MAKNGPFSFVPGFRGFKMSTNRVERERILGDFWQVWPLRQVRKARRLFGKLFGQEKQLLRIEKDRTIRKATLGIGLSPT